MLERKIHLVKSLCRLVWLFLKRDEEQQRSVLRILEAYRYKDELPEKK